MVGHDGADVRIKRAVVAGVALLREERKRRRRTLLFYSESRKQLSPGGDVKLIRSRDEGKSWSEPETLMTHERYGGVPKVIANRACGGENVARRRSAQTSVLDRADG